MLDSSRIRSLRLAQIVERQIRGVTLQQAAHHIQACLVCLDHHHHITGVMLNIRGDSDEVVQLHWDEIIDDHIRAGWADMQEATQFGAAAIAILLILNFTEYTIFQRSALGTGFDYWLLEESMFNEDDVFPQGSARLEVSGMSHAENDSEIRARVRKKRQQTNASDDLDIPAYIAVVEFSRPEAHMVRK